MAMCNVEPLEAHAPRAARQRALASRDSRPLWYLYLYPSIYLSSIFKIAIGDVAVC
jgi:hypothetical protein